MGGSKTSPDNVPAHQDDSSDFVAVPEQYTQASNSGLPTPPLSVAPCGKIGLMRPKKRPAPQLR